MLDEKVLKELYDYVEACSANFIDEMIDPSIFFESTTPALAELDSYIKKNDNQPLERFCLNLSIEKVLMMQRFTKEQGLIAGTFLKYAPILM